VTIDDRNFRLSRDVLPRRVQAALTLDMEARTFAGDAELTLSVERPVRSIVLHAVELDVSQAEVQAGMRELKEQGEFKDGVFRRRADVEGKRNMDGYQAIWEHVNERPMVYPKPRYPQPIFMDPANYEWVPVEGAPGVCEKLMGVFTERRCEARFLRLAPQARLRASGRKIYFVLTGDGQVSGPVSGQAYRRYTTVFSEQEEETAFDAETPTEILVFGLPHLETPAHYAIAAE